MITRERPSSVLRDPFFPVERQSIFLEDVRCPYRKIDGYKAIVDKTTGCTLSVVSNKYRLILNKEAYEWADHVIKGIFIGKTLKDFEFFNILMPKSKASCKIDLIIPNHFYVLFENPNESFIPFLRITNSYNRTKPLKYEIGFCRWICKNGTIFGQKGVSFAMSHSEPINLKEIQRLTEMGRNQIGDISALWKVIENKMNILRQIELPITAVLPIYCKAYGIQIKKPEVSDVQKTIYTSRVKQIRKASKEYFKDLGNNAYAMMNVLSDYASFPEWTQNPANYVDGYQRKVGKWVDEIIEEYKKGNFSLYKHIGEDFQNTAYLLESLVPQE